MSADEVTGVQLLLTPPGAISPEDRDLLREHGVVVVETAEPASCQFMRAGEVVSSNDMLWAAMDALRREYKGSYNSVDKAREQLANNIIGLVINARASKPATDGATS